ncbi:2-oxoacid:acceptor oxidoreductase family protein [Dendrosporobacter sp. 1207_IL3150]|uniref:2-oxoacid:acceptor oxidoreductase family protein n=1 Tax=Dendrosporobacter sp. 1207_IL3150 TaxID=3084054 RepID=UPI002FDAED1A
MTHEIIIAGFGGQGIMLMGQLLAYAGMLEKKHVSWIPSYGPEMRGGTANCSVIVSDQVIGAPIVSEPTILIAMNNPSLFKFEQSVQAGGTIIVNSSLVSRDPLRDDVTTIKIPANDIADQLGIKRVANIVTLGAMLKKIDIVEKDSIIKSLNKVFNSKPDIVTLNTVAFERGQLDVIGK